MPDMVTRHAHLSDLIDEDDWSVRVAEIRKRRAASSGGNSIPDMIVLGKPAPSGGGAGGTTMANYPIEGGTCDECGASLSHAVGSAAKHAEWHALITDAIREQIQEAIAETFETEKELRRQLMEALAVPATNVGSMPTLDHIHQWEEKALLGESSLKVCTICRKAKCGDHSYVIHSDGVERCTKCGWDEF